MGCLAGCVCSGAMVALMMSNAGGAWDNGKKLCEKLKIKKTEQVGAWDIMATSSARSSRSRRRNRWEERYLTIRMLDGYGNNTEASASCKK
jgi:hypothetical protein